MPRINLDAIPQSSRTGYPAPYDAAVAGRHYRRLGPVAGLSALGASHVVLEPGAWSSQRHWHEAEDELLVMLSGEAVLVEDEGETVLRPGDIACWAMAVRSGHHLQNRSDAKCSFVAVSAGDRAADSCDYPGIDLVLSDGRYLRRDGTPYDSPGRPA